MTHTFRGPNVLISALHFFQLVANKQEEETGISGRNRKRRKSEEPDVDVARGYRLASGSQDGKIRIWDLYKRTSAAVLDSHVSDVTSLDYSSEQNAVLSASRDKTVMWWDAKTWKVRKVVPVLEEVEAAGFVEAGKMAYTGGINGNIRVWETSTGREVTSAQSPQGEADAIVAAISFKDRILSVQADHTLVLHSTTSLQEAAHTIPPLAKVKRISGTHDEIIDLGYLIPDRSLLALATNSEELRIVSLGTGADADYFGADVAQLHGHEDIIITSWSDGPSRQVTAGNSLSYVHRQCVLTLGSDEGCI